MQPFPHYPLLWGETPIHPLPRFAEAVGLGECWIKRDDLTGIALGGNKLRKLEYLLGEALSKGCDLLITGGSPQSNHARLTAAVARKAGMDVWLCFAGSNPGVEQGNLLLDKLFGATVHMTGQYGSEALLAAMKELAQQAEQEGRKPYVIPVGGSTPIGDYGYKRAWDEWLRQADKLGLPPMDYLVVPVGTGGTLAGLAAGQALSPAPVQLVGISVWQRASTAHRETLELMRSLLAALGVAEGREGTFSIFDEYIGPKYGVPSVEGIQAIRLLAQTEGILVDPVYTAKALAGVIDLARRGDWRGKRVLFWHTGGTPALFTHAQNLMDEVNKK
ncbi:MAG: 1-aminocyclopropane-1-carboxylate deaminase/D-cysteine desulfhydrase [Planifilum sp.]|jgi:D-cysteine desulfhydrase family pyridoxal phosphate-dependent enzyme